MPRVKLLGMAEAAQLDEFHRARADLLLAQLAFANQGSDAPPLLLKAAKRLEPIDADLARDLPGRDVGMDCSLARPGGDVGGDPRSHAPLAAAKAAVSGLRAATPA